MPRGASPKREHEYEELKGRFEHEGRYKGREQEVAVRIVNKQRARYGETTGAKKQEREGRSPDRGLPIHRYRHLTTSQVIQQLPKLTKEQIQQTEEYERTHKNRKTLIEEMDACLQEQ